jgi:magnesium transporter
VISILPKEDAEEIQKTLGGSLGERVHELITQHDVPASVLAVRRFLQFPGSLTVEDTFTRFRKEAPNSLVTMYVYVVDDEQRLKGVVDINELLQANPDSRLEEIMTKSIITIAPTTMRGDVEALFRRYRFRAIPVVDEGRKIVGVVKEKDAFSTGDEVRLSR